MNSHSEKALDAVAFALAVIRKPWTDCNPGEYARAKANYANLAVNLSAPLAAVARAAMARPWVFCDKHGNEVGCHGCDAKPWNAWIDRRAHDERCRFAKIDDALDALESAAEGVL